MQNFEDAETDEIEAAINASIAKLKQWKALDLDSHIPPQEMKEMVQQINKQGDKVLMLSRANPRAALIQERFKTCDSMLQEVFHRVAPTSKAVPPLKLPKKGDPEGDSKVTTPAPKWVSPVVPMKDAGARSDSLYIPAGDHNTRSDTVLHRPSPRGQLSMGRSVGKILAPQRSPQRSPQGSPRGSGSPVASPRGAEGDEVVNRSGDAGEQRSPKPLPSTPRRVPLATSPRDTAAGGPPSRRLPPSPRDGNSEERLSPRPLRDLSSSGSLPNSRPKPLPTRPPDALLSQSVDDLGGRAAPRSPRGVGGERPPSPRGGGGGGSVNVIPTGSELAGAVLPASPRKPVLNSANDPGCSARPPSPREKPLSPRSQAPRSIKITLLHARDLLDDKDYWIKVSCREFSFETPRRKGPDPSWSATCVVPSLLPFEDPLTFQILSCPLRGIKRLGAKSEIVGSVTVPPTQILESLDAPGTLMFVYPIARSRSAALTVALSAAQTIVAENGHRARSGTQVTSFSPSAANIHWQKALEALQSEAPYEEMDPFSENDECAPPAEIVELLRSDEASWTPPHGTLDTLVNWVLKATFGDWGGTSFGRPPFARWRSPGLGRTLLHFFVLGSRLDGARLLLGLKAEVSALDQRGLSPLHVACTMGNEPMVSLLLEEGENLRSISNLAGPLGMTPLFAACLARSGPCVERMISTRCDVDARDVNGCTALMHATYHGFAECVALLMGARASVVVESAELFSPLMIALDKDHVKIAAMLLGQGDSNLNLVSLRGQSPLWIAIAKKQHDLVDMMLQQVPSLDLETPLGAHKWTILMRVLYELDDTIIEKVVPKLLHAGANPGSVNDSGKNCLWFAVASGKRIGTALILKALPNAASISVDAFDNTPLHFVMDEGIAAQLIGAGFSTTAANKFGNTPIHVAWALNFVSMAQYFEAQQQKKEIKPNKNGNKPEDCRGIGVERAMPFYQEDKTLKEFGGLLLRDGHLKNKVQQTVSMTTDNW